MRRSSSTSSATSRNELCAPGQGGRPGAQHHVADPPARGCREARSRVAWGSQPQHDPDAVDGFIAEDYVNHNYVVEDGREANRAFWAQWFAAFPDTEVTLDDVLVDGDRVAGRFTYRATFQGAFMGIPPTGGPVEMHSIDIWRVVAGMAVEHWDQLDGQAFFAQLTGETGSR